MDFKQIDKSDQQLIDVLMRSRESNFENLMILLLTIGQRSKENQRRLSQGTVVNKALLIQSIIFS